MKNNKKRLALSTAFCYAMLAVCIFCKPAKSQTVINKYSLIGKHNDTVQVMTIEDLVFYVRDCAKDSVLVKVSADQYMIDKNGNRITEYYIPVEATLNGFAIWLGKKYYR